ncbi:uncharacterized protein LOC131256591 isoform X3 [Magnolia sinica]|uniref:uncharacterized protein LOC131256591 isoform X3 n=1 Tax=Magnolia sinica TaxID=86752 RepID=UPI002659382D|nr:uncharacterized protein LOC131256591 isoform X3 [Magnolia sinica]
MLMNGGRKIYTARERIRSSAMENQAQKKVYLHYNHTDSCKFSRWTARESYEFMYGRPWQRVSDFYSNLVNERLSLFDVFGVDRHFSTETSMQDADRILEASEETKSANVPRKERTGRWARLTFKIVLSYHGGSFDGWQKQPGLNTVQGLVEKSLGRFVDDRKAQQLKDKSLPIEANSFVAGRTDKGVTALQQVCSFYAINSAAPGNLKVISVSKVSREFHPNFSAKWRHYFYIFPLNDIEREEKNESGSDGDGTSSFGHDDELKREWTEHVEENGEFVTGDNEDELDTGNKPRSFSVSRVNQLLQQLEGKSLSYKMFARDTKASRSTGPPTECFVYHARAVEARLPSAEEANASGLNVMCVELVANRFLRRMVRVLVATTIREAAAGADCDALLRLMDATCRRATAPPAPPDGLCLLNAGYQEFKQEYCLIV